MLVQGYEKTNNNVITNYGIAIAIILLQILAFYISVAKNINHNKPRYLVKNVIVD